MDQFLELFVYRASAGSKSRHLGWHLLATLPLLLAVAAGAQEDEDENAGDDADATLETEEAIPVIHVTGSRLIASPGDLAGQLIVLDADAIRAMGEVTLERTLRQLPQNLNPTTERFGQRLNTATNLSGASTVNLRGLGSESTLILVDGKRVGYNGILGGVTDISSIPLSIVERIEIVLDGASAIYGSDAVGGVVNVITRKDYEGTEINLNLDVPETGGYLEMRGSVNLSRVVDGRPVRLGYQSSQHTGLDAADREVTLFQQSIFAGPQYDATLNTSIGPAPVLYRYNGELITVPEWRALSASAQQAAEAITHVVLPPGFNSSSAISSITQLEAPMWGAATQEGFSILPESTRHTIHGAVGQDFDTFEARVAMRVEQRHTLIESGYNSLVGDFVHANNPYNPFRSAIQLRGQRRDLPQPYTETDSTIVNFTADVDGTLGNGWAWEGSFGIGTETAEAGRYNSLDRDTMRAGFRSDGVTPVVNFVSGLTPEECAAQGGRLVFGFCRLEAPPATPIDPFGDLSPYLNEVINAESTNTNVRFGGLLRGALFETGAGTANALIGFDYSQVGLESSAQFQVGVVDASPIGDLDTFDTEATRANYAVFGEAAIPLIDDSGVPWMEEVLLSLSARFDSYAEPDVTYRDTAADDMPFDDFVDPGSESTFGVGVVWRPFSSIKVKLNNQTAFVAPQLNQLLRQTSERVAAGFRGLLILQPNGSLRFAEALIKEGGNPELLPETADTRSLGLEYWIPSYPDLRVRATYSETDYENRISQISAFIIDPNAIPSNTAYIAEQDQWVQDRRWINVAELSRASIDYEIHYTSELPNGGLDFHLTRTVITEYEYINDPAVEEPVSVVGEGPSAGAIRVVPENSMSGQFIWRSHNWETALDYTKRATTTTTLTNVYYGYSAPTLVDLSVTYDLGANPWIRLPDQFQNAQVTFIANNVLNQYGKTTVRSSGGGVLDQTSPDASPLYGRVFNLLFKINI